jgi:DNA-binding NarL/FixJ family response regulator
MMERNEPDLLGTGMNFAPKRALIVDDHPVFRHGLKCLLEQESGLVICGEAETAQEALDAVRQLRPDIVFLDLSLPGANGLELIKAALSEFPNLAILVLSMHDESLYALRALRAGAKGYIMKTEGASLVLDAVRAVMVERTFVSPALSERLVYKVITASENDPDASAFNRLTERELEVIHLIGSSLSTREIAKSLNLSVKTIETHRTKVKKKLGLADNSQMVKFAHEWDSAKKL